MSASSKSIHELPPLEEGGTNARIGLALQDHVAAGHCLDMISDPNLSQVWCESQDDILLIWINASNEEVEFVQVKGHELDQLWSISKLLEPGKSSSSEDDTKKSPCILEKSLQYDRCKEQVRFRIVTARPVKDELKYLTYELGSPHRDRTSSEYIYLLGKVKEKLVDYKSLNGNDCTFWLERTYWKWVHSIEAIRNENLLKANRLVESLGQFLASDQLSELYQRILVKVNDGGLAKWDKESGKKKILRTDLTSWFAQAVTDAVHPGKSGTGKKLEEKLRDAGIPEDQFEAIAFMRLQYRTERLTPPYSEIASRKNLEGELAARLLALRANLDGGEILNNGAAFHATCLNTLDTVHKALPGENRPPLQYVYGYMYNLTDRCTHRFVRAKP